jgi:hypothetical protein
VNASTITLTGAAAGGAGVLGGVSTATIGSQGDPYAMFDNKGSAFQGTQPTLVVVGFYNDRNSFNDTARFVAELNYINQRVGSYADILLWAPVILNGTYATYAAAIKAYALANNLAFHDQNEAWAADGITTQALAYADNLVSDPLVTVISIHPTTTGETDLGSRFVRILSQFM